MGLPKRIALLANLPLAGSHLTKTAQSPWKIAAVVFFVSVAVSILAGAWFAEHRKAQRQQEASVEALALADQIEAMTAQLRGAAGSFADRAAPVVRSGADLDQLREVAPQLAGLRSALVLAPGGTVLFDARRDGAARGLDLSDEEFFLAHAAGRQVRGVYIGMPVFSRVDGAWSIPVSAQMTSETGALIGVAVLTVGEEFFASLSAIARSKGKYVFLLHSDLERIIPLRSHDADAMAAITSDVSRLLRRSDWGAADGEVTAGGLYLEEGASGQAFRRSPIDKPFDVLLFTPRSTIKSLIVEDYAAFLGVATLFSAFLSFGSGLYTKGRNLQERLFSAIEALPEGFVLYDAGDRVAIFNSNYRGVYGASASAIQIGATFETILREGLRNGQYLDAIGREDAWLEQRLHHHRNPQGPIEQALPGDIHLRIQEVRLPNGDTVGFRTDVTELKRQKRELAEKARALEFAAMTDPLTLLNNRRGLEHVMENTGALRSDAQPIGVLHVDLDRFKPINDVFGHDAGDFLLQHVADILRAAVRSKDAVARVGGDEFVVVLAAPTDEQEARTVAERIIAACNRAVRWEGRILHFGASVGIALGPAREMTELLTAADIALFEAKRAGRGRVHLFDAALKQQVHRRKSLSDDLLRALETDEIVCFYQPQVEAAGLRFIGYEALVRWRHPRFGLLGPGQFLGLAEDLGVMSEIDQRVARQAVSTGLELHARGHAPCHVSVNASLGRLTESRGAAWLPDAASLPFDFCIEVLEAIDVDRDFDEISWVLDTYRQSGFQIEIDDFGSGRASLTSLLKIRPDRIKLDIEIVRAAAVDTSGASAMVRAIAEMCKGLNVPMTAEGIENQKHARMMRDLGCDRLQGFHFAKPMSRDDLLEWVGRDRPQPHPADARTPV